MKSRGREVGLDMTAIAPQSFMPRMRGLASRCEYAPVLASAAIGRGVPDLFEKPFGA